VGRRLLIVDDNPGFRRLARQLLEAEGYEVVGAARDAGPTFG
jgi:CheY-like chemotaxis protein